MKNNKIAVFKTGGKQYKVKEGDVLEIEKIEKEPGTKVNFDEVLLISDTKKTEIGTPYIPNAKIEAEVIDQIKGKKIKILKYKPKKRYRRRKGHRQLYTKIKILKIHQAK